MILNSPTISGSLTVTGNIIASGSITLSGSVASASYAANAELLDGLDSTQFTLTSSFAAFTASQNILNGTYATTGSNTFAGIQTINSNLTVTGSITAQTLVVQTITSSVDFVTGSTRFGSISANTHVFTGSMSVSGSGTFYGTLETFKRAYVSGLSTNAAYTTYTSIGASTGYFGVDNSTGNEFAASGGSAYALNIWGVNTYPMIFGTNNTERMRITSGGVVTVNQALSTYGTMAVKGNTDVYTYGGFNIYNNTNINFISIAINTTRAVIGADYAAGGSYMPLCFETGNTERMRIGSNGAVTITSSIANEVLLNVQNSISTGNGLVIGAGSTSSHFVLKVENYNGTLDLFQVKGDGTVKINQLTSNGTVATQSSNGTLYVSSDANLKIEDGYIENGLEKVLALKPRYFYWKDKEAFSADRQLGFYAQEVNAISEETANTPAEGYGWGIYDRGLVALLTKAIQELKSQNDALQSRIETLESK